ncbi:hypothetical protein V6N12_046659 [Hibiscus sabdariffa]|uniref:Cyclic nucleotide-binding domain-containing protein n=1 Tax=Hibiscus sabdariffa TaxID=183260 RepID=A0ABR2A635_9ROSI
MDSGKSKSVRFRDDPEKNTCSSAGKTHSSKFKSKVPKKTAIGKTFHKKELSRVFPEDYEVVEKGIFDPRGPDISRWNKLFLVACLISLFIDPLFFYLPQAHKGLCISVSLPLEIDLTIVRSVVDVFYILQIFVRFRTAYVAPSSRVFGRGELVIDPSKIASRYLHKDFWLDIIAAQPLPQGSSMVTTKNVVRLIIIFQYLLRLYLIFPLSSQIIKATGVTATAWAGAAYNLMLYISVGDPARSSWIKSSNISGLCDPFSNFFHFGIYREALRFGVTSEGFFKKYLYCLWWGLRNLSSLGQGLSTGTNVGDIIFAIIIAILGLVLFALLIGNMQTYLQSTTVRLEEWRIRRTDTEQWMHHRQLPYELRKNVRRYDQYRWVATRGVDEEAILKSLPTDLRRDIKRHLCLDLVRQVPLFDLMDDQMLDAICERLKPCLCTPSTRLVREGDPVNEMLFIIRGHLDSCTTNGGRTGFFNSSRIGPGDFCGEELLTWALDPCPSTVLPSSTRTVKAITEVEAFALVSEDLKFVASQFRRLHSKKLKHTFRFHSHQWRTWAACFIQAAWFRYKRRKGANELTKWESMVVGSPEQMTVAPIPTVVAEFASYAAKLAASTRSRGGSRRSGSDLDILSSLQKPNEPDFTVEEA